MAHRSSVPSVLEIHLLGHFCVRVDGRAVEEQAWARRKPALLVKLLALEPLHQLHREQAMDFLWPDSDPEAALNNLYKVIHQARRALEPALQSVADSHFILTQGQQVLLRAPGRLWVDVEEFERRAAAAIKNENVEAYDQALAIYEGDLLAEDLYEDWAAARREQLYVQHQNLLMKLALLHQARGEYEQSKGRLRELLARDAANEEAHRRLMLLYALTGDKQQALRQYKQCREILRRELDAPPEQATVKLHERIASGEIQPLAIDEPSGFPPPNQTINSIAIMPLVNMSDDPNMEYLSDGITESIINALSPLPNLKVMARSTIFRYKGRDRLDPREVGRELGVRAVLTGRVLQLDQRLVIGAELMDTADGSQLWGEKYQRRLADIFAVELEISREISEKLRLKLSREEQKQLAKRYTDNVEAYQLYLRGNYSGHKWTEEGWKQSIEYFNQAIDKDPSYALAYAGLAQFYVTLGLFGAVSPRGAYRKAKAAAEKALHIDDTLAEAHASLGFVKMIDDWDWPGASGEFKRALEINPNYAKAHQMYGYHLIHMGRCDEAIAEMKRAGELEPLTLAFMASEGDAYYYARQYDRAIEQCRKALEMDRNYGQAHIFLGRAYEQKSMYEEAIAAFQKAVELTMSGPEALASLGRAYALAGESDEAQKLLRELKGLSNQRYIDPTYIAMIYCGLSEKDEAIKWLEKAFKDHSAWMVHLKAEPIFDGLRSDLRFTDLVRRVGLSQ